MNVQIRAKEIKLTSDIRSHIESAIEGFSKYSLDITTVNVNIKTQKNAVSIEFDIHIAHSEPVVINQTDNDLSTAIDLAIERASKALRRLHTKIIDYNKASIKDLEALDA
jgi:putative sigma-54 modulation protein